MIIDNSLLVSGTISGDKVTGQSVTGTDESVISTNAIDLSQARDIGEGEPLQMHINVVTTVVGATSIAIQAVIADNAELTTAVTTIASTGAITTAALTAGARFTVTLSPRIGSKGKRYLGIRYVIVGAGTAGGFVAGFGIGVQDGQKFYPSGVTM